MRPQFSLSLTLLYNIKANRGSVKSKRKAVSRSVGDTLQQDYTAVLFDVFGSRAILCGSALTLRVRGVADTLSSNTSCMVCNLFALSPALIPLWNLRFASVFKVTFLSASGSLVCLCSPLRCETYASLQFHNYAPFYTNIRLAQRYWPHNTLNNTHRLIHLEFYTHAEQPGFALILLTQK